MTTPPSPPKRLRRRVILLTIAVLALGLTWWSWPRIDQRLVGTWQLNPNSSGRVGFIFLADGSVEIASNLQPVGVDSLPRPWKVRDGILSISEQPMDYLGTAAKLELTISNAWERLTNPSEAFSRYQIVLVTPKKLVLESLDDPGTLSTYHRLQDGEKIDTHLMHWTPGW